MPGDTIRANVRNQRAASAGPLRCLVSPATGRGRAVRVRNFGRAGCAGPRREAALRWIVLPPPSSVLNGSIAHRFLTVAARFGGSFRLGVCPTERKSTFFRQYLGFASMPDHNRLGVKFSVGQTPSLVSTQPTHPCLNKRVPHLWSPPLAAAASVGPLASTNVGLEGPDQTRSRVLSGVNTRSEPGRPAKIVASQQTSKKERTLETYAHRGPRVSKRSSNSAT